MGEISTQALRSALRRDSEDDAPGDFMKNRYGTLEVRPVQATGLKPPWSSLLEQEPILRLTHGDVTCDTQIIAESVEGGTKASWANVSCWFSLPLQPTEEIVAELSSSGFRRRVLGKASFPAEEFPGGSQSGSICVDRPLRGPGVQTGARLSLKLRRR